MVGECVPKGYTSGEFTKVNPSLVFSVSHFYIHITLRLYIYDHDDVGDKIFIEELLRNLSTTADLDALLASQKISSSSLTSSSSSSSLS